jgi:hypothetical protein
MIQQLAFDLTLNEARATGLLAASKAANHANSQDDGWKEKALHLFVKFAAKTPTAFLTEDARKFAEENGLLPPPDGRAWGHVAKTAERLKYVRFDGYGAAKSSNGSPKVLWRVVL